MGAKVPGYNQRVKKTSEKVFLLIIFLILGLFHLVYLDRFPAGINHDEIEYILSAKTYFLTGADLSGSYFPNSIFQTKTEGVISFLPSLILAPYFGVVPINQVTARLPYVLINLITAGVLYLLIKKIFGNERFGRLTAVIFLINPWSFYLSRTATDTAFSLLFYLVGILLMVDNSKKKIWLSFLFLVLGFFSYHGAKVIFIPLIAVVMGYKLAESRSKIKNYWWVLGAGIGIMILYFGTGSIFFNQSVRETRSGDIWLLNQDKLANTVDTYRKMSIENGLGRLFMNKMTVATEIFFQKYLTAFSPEVLFVSGDTRGTYRFGYHGLFYIVDFVLILVGLVNLYKKYPKGASFLISLGLISPLATAVSGVETSVINRSFLLLPVLVILASFGIIKIYNLVSGKLGKMFTLIVFSGSGLIFFLNFLHFYFFRLPITGQENYFFSQKIVANYIDRLGDQKLVVVDKEPREVFLETILYSKNDKDLALKEFVREQSLKFKNVLFVSECPEKIDSETVYIINRSFDKCLSKDNRKSMNEEQFGGPLYYVINDSLCSDFELQSWTRFHLRDNYVIEKLSDKDFCQNWIKEII